MMGQNRKLLSNRPRCNPRIPAPDFFLTNSVSSSSFDSSSTLLKNGSRDGERSTKKQQWRNDATTATRKTRSRSSDPASRRKDAIETYIRRYVTSAPANSSRPNEDDEISTGPRVRLTDNVKIVFDEDRYRKSLSTGPPSESSITLRNFSSIHHIADHKRNVCGEKFRNRFTASVQKKDAMRDDRSFDAKRVLSDGMESGYMDENDGSRILLISKTLGSEIRNGHTSLSNKSPRPKTRQDEHVESLLDSMREPNTGYDHGVPEKNTSQRNTLFRIDGIRVNANTAKYDEFARDFSEFPQPHQIENTTDMNHNKTGTLDLGSPRNESILPDDNYTSCIMHNHNSSGSLENLAHPKQHISPSKSSNPINPKEEMVNKSYEITSKIEENISGSGSESSLRIALTIPSADDSEVAGDRSSGHSIEVQPDTRLSSAVDNSVMSKDDPCFSCPMCVAQREFEEKQKRINSINRPDSLRSTNEEDMDLRPTAISFGRPPLTSSSSEGVELKHVEAYDITNLSGKSKSKTDDDELSGLKTEYRLSLKDIKKETSSPTSPPSSHRFDDSSLHLQGTELQPHDRFSFVSESPIAGFPTGVGKQYPVPEFRPSPLYSRKWVVEKSSPSRHPASSSFSDMVYSTNHDGGPGKMFGTSSSSPGHETIENEIMNMRIPFLIWRNKQKKAGIASLRDNCNGNTITLNRRPGSGPSSKGVGGGDGDKKLTLAQQALLQQRLASDSKTAFPCPPNSPAPEQLVDTVVDHALEPHEGSDEPSSLSQ